MMVNASKIYYTDGAKAAQAYIDKNNIKYTIDSDLSTKQGIVLINNDTGNVKVAYRGTVEEHGRCEEQCCHRNTNE